MDSLNVFKIVINNYTIFLITDNGVYVYGNNYGLTMNNVFTNIDGAVII